MARFISKNILTGLVTILPLVLTIYLLYWFAVSTESLLSNMILYMLPVDLYIPGMGMVAGLAIVFGVGLLMRAYLVRQVFAGVEHILYRMPLINTVYRAFRDFLDYFSASNKKEFEQVVSVSFGDSGMRVIGFVTQANPERLPKDLQEDDNVLVYLPLSYMIGGYSILMPRSAVKPINMSMEEAMRFTLTAGVASTKTRSSGGKI